MVCHRRVPPPNNAARQMAAAWHASRGGITLRVFVSAGREPALLQPALKVIAVAAGFSMSAPMACSKSEP